MMKEEFNQLKIGDLVYTHYRTNLGPRKVCDVLKLNSGRITRVLINNFVGHKESWVRAWEIEKYVENSKITK